MRYKEGQVYGHTCNVHLPSEYGCFATEQPNTYTLGTHVLSSNAAMLLSRRRATFTSCPLVKVDGSRTMPTALRAPDSSAHGAWNPGPDSHYSCQCFPKISCPQKSATVPIKFRVSAKVRRNCLESVQFSKGFRINIRIDRVGANPRPPGGRGLE